MAKKEIEIILKTPDDLIKTNTTAIVGENAIKYREKDILVVLKQDSNTLFLTRENNEYQLNLEFQENKKTLGSYLLKDNNIMLELEILTKDLKIDKNTIYIMYELHDEIREYIINIKDWYYVRKIRSINH